VKFSLYSRVFSASNLLLNLVGVDADNLKLFHELRGPVYPAAPVDPLDIPSGLPQRPLLDFHQHPGLFNMFDPDN
jgi:hypothetical protein